MWIGLAGANDLPLLSWPATSAVLTPCYFFLWDILKDKVFVPPLPQDLQELKQRITNVLNTLTWDILSQVWQELDHRVDIFRVTGGVSRNLDNCSLNVNWNYLNKLITMST
ncbi:hypothetical protein AVEN_194798-1 [Araneus ventricosus]|uniref:Uncharacterized protein n=1 Tax=Araneus ventricosus TaxID=182803 RepID=A0A4Y2B2Y0_ARAVE|nr:hypothetical protein AVEN_194798-1 [Araneus ventricosus]